ncbi:hypothetical protein BA917_08280 [Helicobacter pullorum]|uniref:Uncharacterized protein n=1 Tax=Helicobacter pullorum TaxID=35818 RepID=A0A0N0LTJ4_9HELI|nr:hypothetical protein [Helicobacter pullorum]KPH55981.1 hypothetical protein HPU229334_05490 [Helicobacter pullorum]OCR18779.1 hypothetical protein BA917_08280 [Helicobacter pullorum]
MNLILPVAGKSSRFPNLKPKWLLTHPNGNMMIVEAIKGLKLEEFDKIYLICIQEHYKKYELESFMKNQFKKINCEDKLQIIVLEKQTDSQPQTIYEGIKKAKIKGGIYIKDSDNYFVEQRVGGNFVSICDLNETDIMNARSKSYVLTNEYDILTNISEKKIISSKFNVGGYSFEDCELFCKYYEKISHEKDLYISHIIYSMMLDNHSFGVSKVQNYMDWGTLKEWNFYKSQFATLFVDIDGTLVYNSGEFISPRWGETNAIAANVEILNKLYDTGKVYIILTTARSLEFKEITEKQLQREGIKYHQILYGLFHAKRIIINDYEKSNPYKSCDSINLKRNSEELKEMLEDIMHID